MAHNGSMLNLWIVRDGAGDALLAKVQNEVYVLAFTSAVKATRTSAAFLIVAANVRVVVERARAAAARGFIIDYDTELARFSSAHPLPSAVTSPTAAAR
jgi:hypothetical protein